MEEINLKDLIYYILKHWRSILVGMLTGLVAFPLIKIKSLIHAHHALASLLIKDLIIGLVIGLFVMVIIYMIIYYCTSKYITSNLFIDSSKLYYYGGIPKEDDKHNNKLDKFIKRLFGYNTLESDSKKLLNVLKKKIVLDTKNTDKTIKEVVVVSSHDYKDAEKLSKLLKDRSIEFIPAGDIYLSDTAIKTINDAKAIIIVERVGKSNSNEYKKLVNDLTRWNKVILGTVLFDIESM